MNRRFFSQWMAFGAGSLSFWTAAAQAPAADAAASDDAAKADKRTSLSSVGFPPVNVSDFQALARKALPEATYDYITTGSTDEVTLRENVEAFRRIRLLPPLLTGVAEAETATTVLKQPVSMPILLAPVAGQSLYHPQGVLGAARAAAGARTVLGVSSSVGHSVEEVAAASDGPKWFQLYVPRDRAVARKLVERAERAGYKALIVTVDLGERKDADIRNRFSLPPNVLRKHLTDIGFSITEEMTHDDLMAMNAEAWDLSLSWDFFDWLRSITQLPLLVKGVLRTDDAKKAVSLGIDGIVVSNHGGRRLDGVPASIERLPKVVEAVAGRAEVFVDSGVRRGTDVLKALALGARAALIGRPYAWALAADGEAGVSRILQLLHEELVSAMIASGCANLAAIDRSILAD